MRRSWFLPLLSGIVLTIPIYATPASAAPTCYGKSATIVGTPQADTIRGTPGDDVIVADGGNDNVNGSTGTDTCVIDAGDFVTNCEL